jgi:hypothetical protein
MSDVDTLKSFEGELHSPIGRCELDGLSPEGITLAEGNA